MHLFWLSPCFLHADCLESFHGHAGGDERTQAGQLSGHSFLVPLLVQSTGPPLVGLHFLFFLSLGQFLFSGSSRQYAEQVAWHFLKYSVRLLHFFASQLDFLSLQ